MTDETTASQLDERQPGEVLADFLDQGFTRPEAFTLLRDMFLVQMGVTEINYGLPNFEYTGPRIPKQPDVPIDELNATISALRDSLEPYLSGEDIDRVIADARTKFRQGEARD